MVNPVTTIRPSTVPRKTSYVPKTRTVLPPSLTSSNSSGKQWETHRATPTTTTTKRNPKPVVQPVRRGGSTRSPQKGGEKRPEPTKRKALPGRDRAAEKRRRVEVDVTGVNNDDEDEKDQRERGEQEERLVESRLGQMRLGRKNKEAVESGGNTRDGEHQLQDEHCINPSVSVAPPRKKRKTSQEATSTAVPARKSPLAPISLHSHLST